MAAVEVSIEGAVGLCRIASPETRNALSPTLMEELTRHLEALDAEAPVRCIVVAGSDEVFATGADPASLSSPEAAAAAAAPWERIAAIEKPLIAAVSGWALGSGCELALACDLIVASKTARFGQPEVALGLIPGGGATQRLTRALGKQRAMELILTGRRMGAEQAHGYGLVNVVTDRRRWLSGAIDLAAQIAARAPIATRLAKLAILTAEEEPLIAGLRAERRLFDEAMGTEDRVEGVEAFLQGRPPRFEGR